MTRIVIDAFEQAFRERFDVPHAVAVNSGTSALIAALWSLDLQPGDEVVTTPYTFLATANAVVIAGGTPVFADINPETLLLDPDSAARHISPRTRALLPVHLFGRVCEMDRLNELARLHDLAVIEDTAQALGAVWSDGRHPSVSRESAANVVPVNGQPSRGRYAGTLADCGCFSFYKTKNLSTFEGGMIAVPESSRMDAAKIRAIINQGDTGGRHYEYIGFNFRMPEPCALIGLQHLKFHWPGILAELGRYGPADGYYPRVVYQHPAYRKLGIEGNCPVAEQTAQRVASRLAQEAAV